jgi:DNA invertase Pin-like site-specific DNA recombinase
MKGWEPKIDTGGAMGRMVLTVLGMVAEMELGFIRDRQRAGIDAAKVKGVYKGRPAISIEPASSPCATKGWAPRRSLGPSGASGATSIRRSRPRASK